MNASELTYCENRFQDLRVSQVDAYQIGEALGWLHERNKYEVMTTAKAKEMTYRAYLYLNAQANYSNLFCMAIMATAHACVGMRYGVSQRLINHGRLANVLVCGCAGDCAGHNDQAK